MEEIMQMLAAFPPEARLEMVEGAFADQKRLNKLQALTEKFDSESPGTILMTRGQAGWQLFETEYEGADSDVRGAIDRFFAEFDPEGEVLGL